MLSRVHGRKEKPRPEGRGEGNAGTVPRGLTLEADADREAEGPRELVARRVYGLAERRGVVPVRSGVPGALDGSGREGVEGGVAGRVLRGLDRRGDGRDCLLVEDVQDLRRGEDLDRAERPEGEVQGEVGPPDVVGPEGVARREVVGVGRRDAQVAGVRDVRPRVDGADGSVWKARVEVLRPGNPNPSSPPDSRVREPEALAERIAGSAFPW